MANSHQVGGTVHKVSMLFGFEYILNLNSVVDLIEFQLYFDHNVIVVLPPL